MAISKTIHAKWREVEDIATAATGPTLIVASIVAATDVFSNGALSLHAQWLPLAWAAARAAAVTMWLGIAFDFYLKQKSGWWLIMSVALFGVDLQTALLFAIQDEHLRDVGTIPLVTIPAIYWVFEQAILGVVLIAVHRAVIYQTHTAQLAEITHTVTVPALVRPHTQPDAELPGRVARQAYWDGPVAPLTADLTADREGGRMQLVTNERDERLTRQTSKGRKKAGQRRDAGRVSPEVGRRRRRLMGEIRRQLAQDHVMTIEDAADYLNMSRGTAVTDRQKALELMEQEYPDDYAEYQRRYRQHGPHLGDGDV